jgi:hypothetical protein
MLVTIPSMRTALIPVALAVMFGFSGCGGPTFRHAHGDPDGVSTVIEVELSRQYVRDLGNRGPGGREYVVYGPSFVGSAWGGYGYRGYPYGYCPPYYHHPIDPFFSSGASWSGPAPTSVFLLAGDGPGQARLLRTELEYGLTVIDLPIRPGRQVTLTVQAYGGYEGWETLGTFTAADKPGQRVVIDAKEHAPRIIVTNPDGSVHEAVPPQKPASAPEAASIPNTTPASVPTPAPAP